MSLPLAGRHKWEMLSGMHLDKSYLVPLFCYLHTSPPFLALDCLSLYLGFPTDHVAEGEGDGETGAK